MTSRKQRALAAGAMALVGAGGLAATAAVADAPDRITIEKSARATVAPGGLISYDITVTNTGPGVIPLFRVQVSDPLATTLAEPVNHDIRPGNGPGTVAKMIPPGGQAVWKATRLVSSGAEACGQVVENTATAWLAGNSKNLPGALLVPRHALVTSNVARTTVVCLPAPAPATPAVAPLALTTALSAKKVGPALAHPGQRIVYRLTLTNTGPNPASDVVVRDALRAGYSLVRRPQGATIEGGSLVWRLGILAPGQRVEVTVPLIILGRPRQMRCNTVTLTASNAQTATDRACTRIFGPVARPPAVTG